MVLPLPAVAMPYTPRPEIIITGNQITASVRILPRPRSE